MQTNDEQEAEQVGLPKSSLSVPAFLILAGAAVVVFDFLYSTSDDSPYVDGPERFDIGVSFAQGGLGDRSYNDALHDALADYSQMGMFSVELAHYVEGEKFSSVRSLVDHGHDVIVGLGPEYKESIFNISREFPNEHFIVVDFVVDSPNVTSFTFDEWGGDFLAGALSGLATESNIVGFLGGGANNALDRMEEAWKLGVKCVRPDATIVVEYATGRNDYSGFSDPEAGYRLAKKIATHGADIAYIVAGRTGLGAIEYFKTTKTRAIMTSSDQDYLAPNTILTSRIKNFRTVVKALYEKLRDNSLKGGETLIFDYSRNGVELLPLDPNDFDSAEKFEDISEKLQILSRALTSGALNKSLSPAPGECRELFLG